ncbi:glutamine synthetase [Plakobranchus ocellatus]|uniref:Lengsin n=1 Tax=Plakobranchus ocellatus TaxID=259542 RepID=A0AAV3YLJ8_9GAST|nr:glutamine synthetase [Plakobranchus ocellatus]
MSISFGRLSEGRYDPEEFDIVFVSCVDLHGVARGRFVLRSSFPGVIKHGLGMTKGALLAGIKGDMPIGLTDLLEQGWTSGVQMPDMTTLQPLSWLSTRTWKEDTSPLLFCLAEALERSGMQIETVGLGLELGKLQISVKKQPVLDLADTLYRLHQAVRSLCGYAGYDITYMTQPLPDVSPNRTEYTWCLIDKDRSQKVFCQSSESVELSSVGRHWLSGQLQHNSAICALARPTVNCYRQMVVAGEAGETGTDKTVQTSWNTGTPNR